VQRLKATGPRNGAQNQVTQMGRSGSGIFCCSCSAHVLWFWGNL